MAHRNELYFVVASMAEAIECDDLKMAQDVAADLIEEYDRNSVGIYKGTLVGIQRRAFGSTYEPVEAE